MAGPPIRFMASRCAVASSSDCPPDRKAMPGNRRGNAILQQPNGFFLRDLFNAQPASHSSCPAPPCWGFRTMPSQRDAAGSAIPENVLVEHVLGHIVTAVDVMIAIHQGLPARRSERSARAWHKRGVARPAHGHWRGSRVMVGILSRSISITARHFGEPRRRARNISADARRACPIRR